MSVDLELVTSSRAPTRTNPSRSILPCGSVGLPLRFRVVFESLVRGGGAFPSGFDPSCVRYLGHRPRAIFVSRVSCVRLSPAVLSAPNLPSPATTYYDDHRRTLGDWWYISQYRAPPGDSCNAECQHRNHHHLQGHHRSRTCEGSV